MTTASKPLGKYKGRTILSQAASIRNAGDGLSAPLALDPQDFGFGDEAYIVLECRVHDFGVRPVKETDGVQEVVVFKAHDAMIVDRELVIGLLAEQRRRIEEAEGIMRLELENDLEAQEAAEGDRATDAKASKPPTKKAGS